MYTYTFIQIYICTNQDFPFCDEYNLITEHLALIERDPSSAAALSDDTAMAQRGLDDDEEWSTCDEDEGDDGEVENMES